jgi:hypothetical protein
VLNYAGFISQARDDLETCFSCIIRGLKLFLVRRFWNTRQGGLPLPQGRANYKFYRGSDKCMALVRSVDVSEHVIGLYFVVISHEIWNIAFNKEYLHTIVLKRKSWRTYRKKLNKFYGNVIFMQSGKLQNGEKNGITGAVRSRDQYDYRSGMIAGPVWEKDQYDHTTGIIKGPVWLQDRYHQGLVWSQDHCEKDEYEIRTSMITGPVSSRDQYDHMTGVIKGSVW